MAGVTTIPVYVPTPDVVANLAAGWTHMQLMRAASRTGTYTAVVTMALDATVAGFVYADPASGADYWYKTRLWGGSSGGPLSDPFPALGVPNWTARTLIRRAAREVQLWEHAPGDITPDSPSGSVTASAADSTYVSASAFVDSFIPDAAYQGWFYSPAGGTTLNLYADRRIARLDHAAGEFQLARTLPVPVVAADTFDLFALQASGDWLQDLNRAFRDLWGPFVLALGAVENQTEYQLPQTITRAAQVETVWGRLGTSTLQHTLSDGPDFDLLESAYGGGVTLQLRQALPKGSVFLVKGTRRLQPIAYQGDSVLLDEEMVDIVTVSTAAHFAERRGQGASGITDDLKYWRDTADRLWKRATQLQAERNPVVSARVERSPMTSAWGSFRGN